LEKLRSADVPNLAARADTAAGVLSSGEKQMLTICRTLMGDPELVMIDEPTEGLAPTIVQQVGDLIADIARQSLCCRSRAWSGPLLAALDNEHFVRPDR
jgi:ABC-type branched-subunit amino acid transport system ATPase component